MKRPGKLKSFIAGTALVGTLATETGCKGQNTEVPKTRIEIANLTNAILGLGRTQDVPDDHQGFYGYQTTEQSRDAAYRQIVTECVFSLPKESLHGEVTENRREICYVVNEGARSNCVAITLNPREDGLFDAAYVHAPRGPVSVDPIDPNTTNVVLTPGEEGKLVNLWEEEANACYYLMEQYQPKPEAPAEEPKNNSRPEGEVEAGAEAEGSVDGGVSGGVSGGASVGGTAKTDAHKK